MRRRQRRYIGEARGRRPGEIRVKVLGRLALKGENPRGASGDRRPKPASDREGTPPEGQNPEAAHAAGRLSRFVGMEDRGGKTARGCTRIERAALPPAEEKAPKGQIPRAPPARNKAGTALRGEKRREGNQTLRLHRSG